MEGVGLSRGAFRFLAAEKCLFESGRVFVLSDPLPDAEIRIVALKFAAEHLPGVPTTLPLLRWNVVAAVGRSRYAVR